MTSWKQLYREKLRTAADVAKLVKNGDVVEYAPYVTYPRELDVALAKRKDELSRVYVKGCTFMFIPEVFKADPQGDVFLMNDSSFSGLTRKMKEQG